MSDRSEKPTARRRQRAEDQGQVLRSREFAGVWSLTAGAAYLWLTWRGLLLHLEHLLRISLSSSTAQGYYTSLRSTLVACIRDLLGVCAVVCGVAVFALFVQHPRVTLSGAKLFTVNQLSPIGNAKKILTISNSLRITKAAVCGLVIAIVSTSSMRHAVLGLRPGHIAQIALESRLAVQKGLLVMIVDAALGYLHERRKHEVSLRMTKQEVREEASETEGNPHVKSRIRRLRNQMRRSWRPQDVKRATVVLVNPTHLAVALEYGPQSQSVPTVIAKGMDAAALKIREMANWHEIAIVESITLARELYRTCDVGERIPQKLYVAVAEVLAWVYRADTRMRSKQQADQGL